ncbi:hypothetical protein HWV62_31217 [Athelia sp. TMB]|nr:hypothetical protein HWV62_31217 [Athelia sp. TMB]
MPGLGKSQLALQFSKLGYTSRKYACIFWISANIEEKISQGLTGILDLVDDKDRHHLDHAVRLMAARRWLEKSPQSWLLILDDVTANVIPFLREHLPRENIRGAIIITTRTCQVAEAIVKGEDQCRCVLELKPLSIEQSAMLLMKAAGFGNRGDSSEKESAEKLVRLIGCLPLAVEQAGAFMKQKHIPAEELQALYDRSYLENVSLLKLYDLMAFGSHSKIMAWENTLGNYEKKSVLAAFNIPLQNLRQVSPNACDLFIVLAYFDPESIPLDILARGAEIARSRLAKRPSSSAQQPNVSLRRAAASPPRKRRKLTIPDNHQRTASVLTLDSKLYKSCNLEHLFELICSKELLRESMSTFEECSLAQPVYGKIPSVHIHDLIQLIFLHQSAKSQREQEYYTLAATLLTSAFETLNDYLLPQSWAECERFVPHVASLEKHRPLQMDPSREFMDMSRAIARYFQKRGRFNEAEALLSRVLAQCETVFGLGVDHLDTLTAVHTLASIYSDKGKYGEAERLYARALAGRETQLGEDHPDALMTLRDLAYLRYRQGNYNQAEELFTRALAGQEQQLGTEHLDSLNTVEDLAHVYGRLGTHVVAESLYARVLAGREKQLGLEHLDTLTTMSSLGDLYREQEKYDEAEPLLARVLRSAEAQLGTEHPDTLRVVQQLACLYLDQGKYDEAETLHARVLAGYEKQLGAEHPRTLIAVHNFALLREHQGRWEEAEELCRRALAGAEKTLGRSDRNTGIFVRYLADLFEKQGNCEEAEGLRARFKEAEQEA